MRAIVQIGALVVGSVLAFLTGMGVPAYYFASGTEASWSSSPPESKSELEAHLSLYSTRIIQPEQSWWGREHILGPDDEMVQYLLLWDAPLDVVYDSSGHVLRIYSSYE